MAPAVGKPLKRGPHYILPRRRTKQQLPLPSSPNEPDPQLVYSINDNTDDAEDEQEY